MEDSLIGPIDADIAANQPVSNAGLLTALHDRLIGFACWISPIVIPRLPRTVALLLGWLLGNLVYKLMGNRRFRIAQANLTVAFGALMSERAKRNIIRRSVCNEVRVLVDMFWFSRDRERRIRKYVWYDESCDKWAAALKPPGVGISAHFGNWEILSHALAIARDLPLAIPYSPVHQPLVRRLLEKLRAGTNTIFIPRDGAGTALWDELESGRRSVAIMLDQNELPERGGGFVDFFGLPVPAPLGAARLALWTNLPVVAIFCVPDGPRYRVRVQVPDFAADQEALRSDPTFVTQRMMNVIEERVRQQPELWMWVHRRWNYIPFGKVSFKRYPFYAQKVIVPRNVIARARRQKRAAQSAETKAA